MDLAQHPALLYCKNLTSYSRFKTREVKIGDIPVGGNNPIRIQSMTTTDTMDTIATVEQSIRMIEAGCEYVRITAPSIKEAENLANIKAELKRRGYNTPLIADIHFTPNAAELAAKIVEKVRVNPGNYADKKKFDTIDYSDSEYQAELERIRKRFTPLVKICKEHGTAMRIGTNHGSLSDRIMSRYGDTPLGMVESALEFLRICEEHNYYNLVLSMKASNPQIMVQAYRLLVKKMIETGRDYPLHLGVTEAGEGEDGRIKSAVGIGALLEDGIGDTVRVSLTEEPEFEIPVARTLVSRYTGKKDEIASGDENPIGLYNPYEYKRRATTDVGNIGGTNVPRVIADFSHKKEITAANLFSVGYNYSVSLDKWNLTDQACDYIYMGSTEVGFELPGTLRVIVDHKKWKSLKDKSHYYPLLTIQEYISSTERSKDLNFVSVSDNEFTSDLASEISKDNTVILIANTRKREGMLKIRELFLQLLELNITAPVIIKGHYSAETAEEVQLFAATDAGSLLLDGLSDGIWINTEGKISSAELNSTSFGILQATRTRISKTEYISCPSCGRTLFDLQETTARIRKRTDHLKGIKIGIMGCIVNGPGEMADADYGYVGTGVGKITLYKGKEVVKRNIDSEHAVDALIELIKANGDWIERDNSL